MNAEAARVGPSRDREALGAVAAFLPVLQAADFTFGCWEQPPPDSDGTMHFPYFVMSPDAQAFVGTVGRIGWVLPGFDWRTWGATDEGAALRRGGDALANATPRQLAQLMTLLIRQERFVEGSLAEAYEQGVLTAITARARDLVDEPRSAG